MRNLNSTYLVGCGLKRVVFLLVSFLSCIVFVAFAISADRK